MQYRILSSIGALVAWILVSEAAAQLADSPSKPTPPPAAGQDLLDGREGRDLLLRHFRPRPRLKVRQHLLTRAKFPVVDIHTHFDVRFHESREQLDAWIQTMDRNNIAACISLDGRLDRFEEHRRYLSAYPGRFLVFANIDWRGTGKADEPETWACQQPGFAERTAQALAEARRNGACGLKLFKHFGLEFRNPDGSWLAIDDPRWDPIWTACGELGIPVIIHTADPAAFFLPIDETNERWEELHRRPEWSFPPGKFPSREELLAARNRVIARHPRTRFIGAHMAESAEDLETLTDWLERYPNLYVEPASRISELGRQPYTSREFLIRFADRILFGTDGPWPEPRLMAYWRFFETYDEYFPYSEKDFPPQGLWNIYGVGLPDDVLKKIYHENAARLIPGVADVLRGK